MIRLIRFIIFGDWLQNLYRKLRLWWKFLGATRHVSVDYGRPGNFSAYVVFKRLRDGTMLIEELANYEEYQKSIDVPMKDLK